MAPLIRTGTPARAVVVLRIDTGVFIGPLLRGWPVPSRTAESLLVRADGGMVGGTFGRAPPLPLSTPDLLSAQAIRGEQPLGTAYDGTDFHGVPVTGVVRRVRGTDWYLVVKIDRSELMANAMGNSVWIIAAGLLALFALALGLYAAREREALRVALAQGGEREAKLRALALLDSLTEGSTDSIFARDLHGHFLLRNRAALEGLPFKNAGGSSLQDLALPDAEIEQLRANDARVISEGRTISLVEHLTTAQGPRTFQSTKGPLRDGQGAVIGVFGIARDITERQRIGDELAQHRHRLQELVQERTAELQRAATRAWSSRRPSCACWQPTFRACSATGIASCTAASPTSTTRAGSASRPTRCSASMPATVLRAERYDANLAMVEEVLNGRAQLVELEARSPTGRVCAIAGALRARRARRQGARLLRARHRHQPCQHEPRRSSSSSTPN